MSGVAVCLELPRALDAELAAELEKQSAWVSPRVRDVRVDPGGRAVRFVVQAVESEVSAVSDERAKVARFVMDLTDRHRALSTRVVARRERPGRALGADPFGELARRGWVVETSPGRVSLRGPALAVVRALDEDCLRIATEVFGAVEERHPALAAASVLARCGSFGSFPQTASFVAHLVEDYDIIESFRRDNAAASDFVRPGPTALAPADACLLPALCYAVYAAREGTDLPPEGLAVTCAGRCFRYESRNLTGVERLWEFGMRELVFLGADRAVDQARARAVEAAQDQLERWDLAGSLETANDPFFAAERAGKAYWQRSGERKLELRLPVGTRDGQPHAIACASFNLHDHFFGSAFAIGSGAGAGEAASSACAGWGMERWMLACFAQHGFEPEAWPTWLQDRVFR
jgi:seryl-tRNA synthetase